LKQFVWPQKLPEKSNQNNHNQQQWYFLFPFAVSMRTVENKWNKNLLIVISRFCQKKLEVKNLKIC
jgi:hypothetical protein